MKYTRNNETTNKYLAGMLDADGHIGTYLKRNLQRDTTMRTLQVSIELKRDEYGKNEKLLLSLFDHYQFGKINRLIKKYKGEDYPTIQWMLYNKEAQSLLNVVKKHLVIKGTVAIVAINIFLELGSTHTYTPEDITQLRRTTRDNTGPIKPKKHFTWAWLAGYIDGDGSIQPDSKKGRSIRFHCHIKDIAGVQLIANSMGREVKVGKDGYLSLVLPLGKDNRGLVKNFLTKLVGHLKLKKYPAEQILKYHNKPPAETK